MYFVLWRMAVKKIFQIAFIISTIAGSMNSPAEADNAPARTISTHIVDDVARAERIEDGVISCRGELDDKTLLVGFINPMTGHVLRNTKNEVYGAFITRSYDDGTQVTGSVKDLARSLEMISEDGAYLLRVHDIPYTCSESRDAKCAVFVRAMGGHCASPVLAAKNRNLLVNHVSALRNELSSEVWSDASYKRLMNLIVP
jgi:hypothetical protein